MRQRIASMRVLVFPRFDGEFATDPASVEWLAAEKADIEIDVVQDTVAYGHTGERMVLITYAVDLDPDTFAPTAAEQLYAEDLDPSTQES